ncbi:oligoendopeptidase F [Brevibacillus sp. HB1.2]|uniref:oligoendopeptidase F n=1 Tax=Brevibacillus TaxID=55080 RepID=UPI00036F8A4C|nr:MULTISPECIES: oligoendopeptidase F [unclassified Brevibacillus]ATF16442.1 oligoendopeptidase F [Brevibacillus brevis X23]MDC0763640.1 oligoendopeptidase F [Brevibacillus sp. AG]NRS18827.1 oligoendopeptidase F [Brevibacillus sp. HB1.4B]NTU24320.1 oligoendopeptidase F [Brevibacillus sp. HB1.2]NTU33717.1 oligoendopeptidase F [Brevibacillus sp. HB1.1]
MKKQVFASVTALAIALSTVSVPFIPYSTQAVALAAEKPSYQTRAEIPDAYKWKLDHIYPTVKEWEKDVAKVESLANAFTKHQGKLGTSSAAMQAAFDDYVELMRLNDKAYVYANMSLDVNSANPDLQKLGDRGEKMSTLVTEKTSWVQPEIVAIPDDKIKSLLSEKELEPYKLFIEDMLRTKPYSLSADMEQLLAKSSPLGGAPTNIYSMLSKDVRFPKIKDETGKEVQLTRANFISYLESKDQNVRREAFKAYYGALINFQDSFASTLAAKVKGDNFYAAVRNYDSALEASLTPNNVPTKVYDELIDTVNDNLPLLHRYISLKKKMLGVKELHMYDIYVPIVPSDDKYISFDEGKKIVVNGLQVMGDDYVKAMSDGLDGGWVDVYSTDDKRTGAYQWGAYDTHPFVLLNHQGTLDDVYTIAHEMGHAMQSYYTNKNQPYISSNYPIFTAEVASTMNETLLFKSMYAKAKTKEEKMYLLNHYLENFRSTLFRQTQFAEFERAIHEKEQAGESLNAEAIKKIYLDINKKYYGKDMVSDEEIGMEWARVSHFYNYKYYVYQYSTSFAAAQALAKQIMDEGQPAVDRVRKNFLEAGNSAPPIEVLKAAGVDMSTSQPIEQAMEIFEETLNELEKLVNEK